MFWKRRREMYLIRRKWTCRGLEKIICTSRFARVKYREESPGTGVDDERKTFFARKTERSEFIGGKRRTFPRGPRARMGRSGHITNRTTEITTYYYIYSLGGCKFGTIELFGRFFCLVGSRMWKRTENNREGITTIFGERP